MIDAGGWYHGSWLKCVQPMVSRGVQYRIIRYPRVLVISYKRSRTAQPVERRKANFILSFTAKYLRMLIYFRANSSWQYLSSK